MSGPESALVSAPKLASVSGPESALVSDSLLAPVSGPKSALVSVPKLASASVPESASLSGPGWGAWSETVSGPDSAPLAPAMVPASGVEWRSHNQGSYNLDRPFD